MDIDREIVSKVKGFLDEEEGRRLYETALDAGHRGPCLEIGSYCGKSTLYLGAACRKAGVILFSIDHHRGSEEQQPGEEYFDSDLFDEKQGRIDTFPFFRKTLNMAGLEDAVVPLVCPSHLAARAWTIPLSLVFIDGGHSFEAALADYAAWAGHIVAGGYLAVHDIFKDPTEGGQGPYRVYELARASGLFNELPMTKSLGVLQRCRPGEIPESRE